MSKPTTIAIDLAKTVFHLCVFDAAGRVVSRKKLKRSKLHEYMQQQAACLVLMEACGGAHYWGRCFMGYGHHVKLIAPQFVKPFRKSQKNDHHDAEAIGIAGLVPTMRFVGAKRIDQQAIQQLHRARELVKKYRTGLSNQIRGFLMESGVVVPKGISKLCENIPLILEDADNELIPIQRELIDQLYQQLKATRQRLDQLSQQLEQLACRDNGCQQLIKQLPGVGPLSATALFSAVADVRAFAHGRQLSAWIGLVPSQHTTGGRVVLGKITKQGQSYIRQLLIHGARSVIAHLGDKHDKLSIWLRTLVARVGVNKAAVALANKNARMAWAIMIKTV